MVKELKKLSPAEILLLIKPDKSTASNIAKLTFLDLVFRKILAIEVIESKTKSRAHQKIVKRGNNFTGYTELAHECLFLKAFVVNHDLKVSISNCVKMAFENVKSTHILKMKYVYSKRLAPYFSSNLLQFLMGTKSVNKKGMQAQEKINKLILDVETEINIKSKWNEKLVNQILLLKGNVFLLDKVEDKVFEILKTTKQETIYHTSNAGLDYAIFDSWGIHSNNFNFIKTSNNAISAGFNALVDFDTTPSQSHGTDSVGCSGCSGCSGCGGCGS